MSTHINDLHDGIEPDLDDLTPSIDSDLLDDAGQSDDTSVEPTEPTATADVVARRVRTYQRYALAYALLGLILGVLSACTAREMLDHAHSNPWASIVGLSVLIPATVGGAWAVCSGWAACRRHARAALDEQEEIPDDDEDDEPVTTHGSNDDPFGKYGDHGDESERALNAFTQRAMRHGRRAAWCLLAGMTAEVLGLAGFGIAGWFAVRHDQTVLAIVVVAWLPVLLFTLVVAGVTHSRWSRHRARMRTVVENALVWRSTAQISEQDETDEFNQRAYDTDKREAEAEQRRALSWFVPVPACVDHTSYVESAAESARAAVPTEPVEPWLARLQPDLMPLFIARPPRTLRAHSVAEGLRLQRELCRAISKHSDHDFHRLLAEGANPNGHDGSGDPLRKAVLRGRLDHVSWLLTLGADPNAQPVGRTILAAVMRQVEYFADETENGDGDACEWPETIELLARFGANPHIKNRYYDEDDETEGPTAWPFILKRPVLYEAYMKGHNTWEQADRDGIALLNRAQEAVLLAEVADETNDLLRAVRSACRA
jgi:hypothetical protein